MAIPPKAAQGKAIESTTQFPEVQRILLSGTRYSAIEWGDEDEGKAPPRAGCGCLYVYGTARKKVQTDQNKGLLLSLNLETDFNYMSEIALPEEHNVKVAGYLRSRY